MWQENMSEDCKLRKTRPTMHVLMVFKDIVDLLRVKRSLMSCANREESSITTVESKKLKNDHSKFAQMHRLIRAFTTRIWFKFIFHVTLIHSRSDMRTD